MFSICAEKFFEYAMELFHLAGHADISEPEFTNHSAKQFLYQDCDKNFFLSNEKRGLLRLFDNISRLFTVKGIAFFSLNLLTSLNDRSQAAHDIHTLIQSAVDVQATICLSRHADKIIFSFAGYNSACILSDWYSSEDKILEMLDIANMTIADGREYFFDFINIFARRYYFSGKAPTFCDSFPLNFFSDLKSDITREEVEEILNEQRFSFIKEYGNDYVEYDELTAKDTVDNEQEFDLILQDAEDIQISLFSEEDLREQTKSDEDDLSKLDADIFADPELLLEYIEKISNETL